MLLSSSKDQPKINERDLILANALAYVESIERKIAERKLAPTKTSATTSAQLDRTPSSENSNA
jgi:hypothetical protein